MFLMANWCWPSTVVSRALRRCLVRLIILKLHLNKTTSWLGVLILFTNLLPTTMCNRKNLSQETWETHSSSMLVESLFPTLGLSANTKETRGSNWDLLSLLLRDSSPGHSSGEHEPVSMQNLITECQTHKTVNCGEDFNFSRLCWEHKNFWRICRKDSEQRGSLLHLSESLQIPFI